MAARAGMEALTRTLALEWASRGLRLHSVAPGFVASSGLKRYPAGLQLISQTRATCDEIAWMVAFAVSPTGANITGQTWALASGKDLWGDWSPIPDPPGLGAISSPAEPWEVKENQAGG